MAKISALPEVPTLADDDSVVFVQGGVTKRGKVSALTTAARAPIALQLAAQALQYTQPNAFTPAELRFVDTSRIWGGLTRISIGADQGGVPVWVLLADAGFTRSFGYDIPAAGYGNQVIFSAAIPEITAHSSAPAGAAWKGQILLQQFNGAIPAVEIAGTRQTLDIAGPDGLPYDANRRVSVAGVKHADCVTWRVTFTLRADTSTIDRRMHVRDWMFATGTNHNFRQPPPAPPVQMVYVGPPPASDATAIGTKAAPFATLNAALDAINGTGIIWVMPGTYGPSMQFRPDKVKGRVAIVGQWAAGGYPMILMADKLAGITKTAGGNKVHQAAVPGLDPAKLNWVWQHNVPDARTLIPVLEREPQHRGRTHRLPSTKIVKVTDTSSLAAARAEMEAAADPRCYYETGILYFTIAGGGDATAADIRVSAPTGLVYAGTAEAYAELIIQGLDVRYGGMNLTPFARTELDDLTVLGAATNCIDYQGTLRARTLECAGGGDLGGDVGDGLNAHNRAAAHVWDYYGHDCLDDAESGHEGCSMRMDGGLVEYNGGAGVAPAYGCDAVYKFITSRLNQQVRKNGGFCVDGAPKEGVDTLAKFFFCISDRDKTGFYASPGTNCFGIAIGCKAYNPLNFGFVGMRLRDCDHSGTGAPTGPGCTIEPSNRIAA